MRSVLKVRGVDRLTGEELFAFLACADALGFDPDWLACVVSFETAGTFSPSKPNAAGSGAVGLIQFMPLTAKYLGTTVASLAAMSFVRQIEYVRRYLATYKSRVKSLEDCYLAVFYPAAIGQVDAWVVAAKDGSILNNRPTQTDAERSRARAVYSQNAGFDKRGRGIIDRGDVCATIRAVRDAAVGARLEIGEPEPELIDLTDVAREADDRARDETPPPVTVTKPDA